MFGHRGLPKLTLRHHGPWEIFGPRQGTEPGPARFHGIKRGDQMSSKASAVPLADDGFANRRITLPTLATIAVVAAVLHFGQDVFLPLAIAMLITFALSPLVTYLRNKGLPMLATVLAVVTMAFAVIGLFLMIVATQMSQLAVNLPTFQANIVSKLENLQSTGDGTGIVSRVTGMIAAINAEIGATAPRADAAAPAAPMPVEVVERRSAVQMLQDLVLPLISPIATAGLVIVVVVFMLLEREELRDRFIRLVGSNDLHRTTQMLEDAGSRVANYLIIQLLVNVIYAVPIGLGLWFIGVPNAMLWGLLTLVLRFVPYIGTVLAAAFPMFLAFAVSPDWSTLIWTVVLFASVEMITSNLIEPWLYGSRTGVSPLAIIISAIFWTWIWGPMGLVLSTPLTVCLVVLGRHIPQFKVFDILFGDEPVLSAHARLYQRLLAGDAVETTARAAEALEDGYLAEYYRDVGIPALLLAQDDYDRGVLTLDQEHRLADVAALLVHDLAEVANEELADARKAAAESPHGTAADSGDKPGPMTNAALDGLGYRVISIGGRSKLDDVAAAMLGQIMTADGAEVTQLSHADMVPARFGLLKDSAAHCVVLNFLDPNPSRASLLHIRRIKRAAPQLRVGVVIWQMPSDLADGADGSARVPAIDPAKRREAEAIGADFVVTDAEAAMVAAFSDLPSTPLPDERKKPARAKPRLRALAA